MATMPVISVLYQLSGRRKKSLTGNFKLAKEAAN